MKKITALFILLSSLIFSVAAEESLFSFSAGLQSGLVFYGDKNMKKLNKELDGSHVLVGALAEINVNPFKEVTFFAGGDLLCDYIIDGDEHSNHFSLDFPFGIKIYPGIGGLNFALAYTIGIRYDSIDTEDLSVKESTPWGNGLKTQIEYNFAHEGKSKYYPSIGVSWKYIPRGNNKCDNIVAAYIKANF